MAEGKDKTVFETFLETEIARMESDLARVGVVQKTEELAQLRKGNELLKQVVEQKQKHVQILERDVSAMEQFRQVQQQHIEELRRMLSQLATATVPESQASRKL